MKKLFEVRAEVTFYVYADNDKEALDIAPEGLKEEGWHADFTASEVRSVGQIDEDWLNSVPYGKSEDRTCAHIMKEREKIDPQPKQMLLDHLLDKEG